MRQLVHDFIDEALAHYRADAKRYEYDATIGSVLEFGSYDVNGTPRGHFPGCDYVGVDFRAGPGVDVVSFGHDYRSERRFDVGICTEVLEHDAYAEDTVVNLLRHVRGGGLVVITCAADFPEHHPEASSVRGYYRNLTPRELAGFIPGRSYKGEWRTECRLMVLKRRDRGTFYAGLRLL